MAASYIPNGSMNADQLQMQFQSMRDTEIAMGARSGELDREGFKSLMHDMHQIPVKQDRYEVGSLGSDQQMQSDLRQARQKWSRPSFDTDKKQAQSLFAMLDAESRRYHSLYVKYSHGPNVKARIADPKESTRLDNTYDQIMLDKLENLQRSQEAR